MNTIITCCHKLADLPNNSEIIPIHVGAEGKSSLPYLPDNTGENISVKNPSFCELTGMYWYWKNRHSNIIALNHYRRYFDFSSEGKWGAPECKYVSTEDFLNSSYPIPNLKKLLDGYDLVLTPPKHWPYSLKLQYKIFHINEDYEIVRDCVRRLYPEDLHYFDLFFEGNSMSNYNMFICRWEIFDEYCKWLFDILFEAEKYCKLSDYTQQARLYGYWGERLINIFCMKKKLRVRYIPIVQLLDEENCQKYNPSPLRYTWRCLRSDLIYKLTKKYM